MKSAPSMWRENLNALCTETMQMQKSCRVCFSADVAFIVLVIYRWRALRGRLCKQVPKEDGV